MIEGKRCIPCCAEKEVGSNRGKERSQAKLHRSQNRIRKSLNWCDGEETENDE